MNQDTIALHLGPDQNKIDRALEVLNDEQVLPRIWKHDYKVWKPVPTEIQNRLGWLRIAEKIQPEIPRIMSLASALTIEGFTKIILLGMGGSSLAPEVFYNIFGTLSGSLELTVLDSTDPDYINGLAESLNYSKTIFIVSTKSGGTVETLSFFKYFYEQVKNKLGADHTGSHFIAITDPGSLLEVSAKDLNFREIFLNDPSIGGRFSALSFFGMVPAGLLGIDLNKLLTRAIEMSQMDEFGALLGTVLGVFASEGKDKVTFFIPKEWNSFGNWLEQLLAESTGKEGRGLLPVVDEEPGNPNVYGTDRIFINFEYKESTNFRSILNPLQEAGHPTVQIRLKDNYDLGGQFFLWELATSIAGYWLKINPFNQPNVESAKVLARKMVSEYQDKGTLPEMESNPVNPDKLHDFLSNSKPGDYISLQAYLRPSLDIWEALQELRLNLRDRYKLATTLGYGPRFLHSTGQLHKGDSGNGLFIQFTSDAIKDIDIPDQISSPDSTISFGILKMAQALGDGQALQHVNRRFIRFHLRKNIIQDLEKLKGIRTSN